MKTTSLTVVLLSVLLLHPTTQAASWLDRLFKPAAAPATPAELTQDEIVRGLREALSKGVNHAVANLGKPDGFLKNLDVKIPMPPQLQSAERVLRRFGQDRIADEFIATMNRAAEQAVPLAAGVFAGAITNMTFSDAKAILSGPNDAATQYFRRTSEAQLQEKFLPIVRDATARTGVTAAYKNLVKQAGPAATLLGVDSDLDRYITQKSLDGLFKMIAAEEKRIRENPVARSTELLKKVFSAVPK
ncbi:MAG: DUF4197 domain-containing protein [Verrucomicrobiae bacterium]|nr:DUF4197 domain-containing protein [Verrucomicrobiae bacterium]